jgi:predicted helicase
MRDMDFDEVQPDKTHNWINLTSNDFETLIPLVSKVAKEAIKPSQEKAIFKLHSNGVVTARDEWMTDFSSKDLAAKVCAGRCLFYGGAKETDIEGAGNLLRSHPRRCSANKQPWRKANFSEDHLRELLQGLQHQGC